MLAATLADGHTVIRPSAQEPEVDDLIAFLKKMGAEVERTYPDTIEVVGKRRLRGAEHHVIPDRIEAGTFATAGAVTGGRVTLTGAPCEHMTAFLEVLERAGVDAQCDADRITVDGSALRSGGFRACDIETAPYPGLATDIQPPTCVLLTQANGSSRIHEAIFEDRLEWLTELNRMGARVDMVDNHHATIHGRTPLRGAEVEIGDLRAGASLILAALAADGESTIHGAHHVQRGYENIERKFADLGARIARLEEGMSPPAHEDRYRPRHGQRPRLRQGQGRRDQEPSVVAVVRRRPHRGRRRGRPRDDRPDARQHPRDPADEGRRHRRLRDHRGDAPLLHQQGHQRPDRVLAARGDDQRPGGRDLGREARRQGCGAEGRAPARPT